MRIAHLAAGREHTVSTASTSGTGSRSPRPTTAIGFGYLSG
jgi:hypothetical protein